MRIIKFLLKLVFLLLVAVVVYTIFAGWTNLWIQSDQIGLLYIRTSTSAESSTDSSNVSTASYQAPIVIPDNGFIWNWRRAIPFQSTLTIVPLTLQYAYVPYQVRLPNAVLYSTFIQKPADTFDSTGDITIAYRIDRKKIVAYANNKHLMFTDDIQSALIHDIQTNILQAITTTATTENVKNTLGKNAIIKYLQALPIIATETSLVPYTQPDLTLYRLAQESMKAQLNTTLSSAKGQPQSSMATNISQYLLLITQLSDLSRNNPSVLETLKLLPYRDIIPLIEKQQ